LFLTSNVQILREGTNSVAIEERPDLELGSFRTRESIHGRVGTILVVGGLGVHVTLLGTRYPHLEFVSSECLGMSSLVLGLDCEAEDAKARVTGIGTFNTLYVPWGILDGFAFQINRDVVRARFGRIENNVIGAISVIGDMWVHITMRSRDVNIEGITSIATRITITINSMNSEFARLVIYKTVQSRAFSIRIACIRCGFDVDVSRHVLDRFIVQGGIDGIITRFGGVVLHCVGTIIVVSNMRCYMSGAMHIYLEGITTIATRITIGINGMDGEDCWFGSLTTFKTRSFGIRVTGTGSLYEHAVGRALNRVIVKCDVDKVVTRS